MISKPEYVSTFSDGSDGIDLLNKRMMYIHLRIAFLPLLKENFPNHYRLQPNADSYYKCLENYHDTHNYFIRFKIDKFYSTIVNYSIGNVLCKNYEMLKGSAAPLHLQTCLFVEPDHWFAQKPWIQGFFYENELLELAGDLYLLGLCKALESWPFICHRDEFVIMLPAYDEIARCFEVINQELKALKLELNPSMVFSGEVDMNSLLMMDFDTKNEFNLLNNSEFNG